MLSVIFVILTLALVMFLVFKKVNIVIASIIASIVLAVLDGQNVVTAMSETFMTSTANYVKNFFLLFFVSALFGKVMESTGAAAAIARGLANLLGEKFAILGVLFAGMVLTYGGISALVIAFTMYPLTLAVFKRANMPRRLIPGAIAAGCFTFAAAALPGTPQTLNVTPIPYLGTTVTAGAAIGIIGGLLLCFLQQAFGLISLGGGNGAFLVEAYPVSVHATDVLLVFATVIAVGFLSVWYPVRYLSKKLL